MKERCPSGSAPTFCDGGGAGRIASLVPRGAGGPPRESAESRMGGLTVRGPTVRFACRGPHDLPEPATLLSPQPSLALSQALASPEPDAALSLKRFSLAEPTCLGPSPPCLCPSPASERLLPRARPLCAVSSALLASSALRACALAGRKRAFACGVPGALRGTWVSPTRFDEMNDPCPRNVLI
jgi:hypothetical protein